MQSTPGHRFEGDHVLRFWKDGPINRAGLLPVIAAVFESLSDASPEALKPFPPLALPAGEG
jgi:hypothetical protein